MVNEHGALNGELSKKFYSKLWTNLIILFSISIAVLIVLIVTFFNFLKGTEDIKIVIMCLGIFIVILAATIIGMRPFFKDLKMVKKGKFKIITGKIIKYRKVVYGGDPDTVSYYPTIKDIDKDWVEVEVKANDTELNKVYNCVYLPNTKLAVCEELLASIDIEKH